MYMYDGITHPWTEAKLIESHIPGVFLLTFSAWWRHDMEYISTLLAFFEGKYFSLKSVNAELCGVLLLSLTIASSETNSQVAGDLRPHDTPGVSL